MVSDPDLIGRPWGTKVEGLLTFRGNPTRTYYGTGPMPRRPQVAWRYPRAAMCSLSSEYGKTKTWCGTGWNGQPSVFERKGRTWVVFGAYDRKVHFVDAATGTAIIPAFPTGDLAKGTVTIDPDGYPLVYHGSRDNRFRVIAFDGTTPRELWSMDARAVGPRLWNDDWDAAALVINDYLIEGGENSRLHLVKLNRSYGPDGKVRVAPKIVWTGAGWDDQLLRDVGDRRVSLESSVMMLGDTLWVNSSGGLLQGWDFSIVRTGKGTPKRIFRFWTGDDSDSTVVPDRDGYLYVGVEVDRNTARARKIGQLLKIDPRTPTKPVVWAVDINRGIDSGTWSTPVVTDGVVIFPTKKGPMYGIDTASGAILWQVDLASGTLTSSALVDNVLVQGSADGRLYGFDVRDPRRKPPVKWVVRLPANIESTPAVWKGRIYVGTRDGYFYAVADK